MTRGTRFNRRSSLFRWLAAVAILATACAVLALAHTWTTSRAQGGELRFGEPLDAVLASGGVDDWFFAANEGDIVALRVERTDGDLEPALLVSDADGQPIAGTQAAPGTASAALVQVRLPRAGSFVVQVSGAGQTAGAYRLSLDRTQAGPPAATLAPEIAQESAAGAITPGQSVQGEIDDDVFRQLWTLPGQTGDVLDIRVTALSGDLDPFVALLAPGGDVLATNDSADGGRDAGLLAFQLPFNGEYTVVARRAGDAAGRAGVTRGTYRLDVARRNPGDATRNTQLGFGERVRGRLDDAFPVAVYRLEIGGSLALRLDLGSANRLARLRFLSATGDVIAERTGLSPLLASARLEGRGPFLVEVSAQTFDGAPFVDYAVTAFRLSAGVASARPLDDDAPQTWTANGPQTWFFAAEAGDLARLTVTPEGLPSAGVTVVRVRAPGDVILYQGDLTPGIDQELALPSSGLYEIEVRPPEGAASTFRLNLAREGGRGAPFAPFAAAAVDLGPLQPGAPVDATLAPGAVDARWIDAAAGQVITLTATAESDSDIIGLGLQRPDGDFLRVQLSQPDRIALLARVEVPETGRYRAVVFGDPAHILTPAADARPIRYTLRYDQAGGGSLQSGAPVKDFVAPEDGLSVWRLEASGGALLNVRAENLTPAIWSPTLTLLAPGGGALAATSAPTGQGATLEVLGVEAPVSGVYQVVMAGGIIRGQIASYTLQAEVQEPFAPDIAPRVLVAATRLPVDLFEPAAPAEPVRVSIPALLNSPISPTQTGELVHILPFDATTRGEMDAGEAGQTWRFTVGSGLALQVRATSLTRHAGPSLALWDQNGGLVFEQHSAEDPETLMIVRLPQGGTYDLVVSMGLEGGRYLLSLEALDIATGNLQALAGAPLVYGQSAAGESLRPEDEAAYYFFGETGDPVRAQLVRTTGDFVPSLELIGPTGNALAQAQSADGLSAATIDGVRLPTAGVYALRVRNLSASEGGAGRYALYLTLAGDTRLDNRGGGVLRRGETVRGQLGPGDNDDTWLLAGRAGERITLEAVGVDALTPLTLQLADTAGRPFAVRETSFAQTPARITSLLLPADGIYRVQVSGGARAAGLY
ncbi:MAG: hypothetical protein IT323_02140, partial [Anaerolineae bacterium]|nr:hypothetical protein [Anaerolineae bacterium]